MWDISDAYIFSIEKRTHVEYRRFELYMYTFWGGFRYKKRVIFDTIFMICIISVIMVMIPNLRNMIEWHR